MIPVSVCIPLYNKAPYIKETINSVLNQTVSEFELIVVDDGSTDGSQEIVKSIEDKRIKFYQNPKNLGTAKNGNRLFELATGKYLVRLDGDDLAPQNRLELQIEHMERNVDCIASSGKMKTFGGEENVWDIPLNHEEIMAGSLFNPPLYQGAVIIRMELLKKNELSYDENSLNLGEDWLLWFKMGRVGKLSNLDNVLNLYRIGEQNVSNYESSTFYDSRKHLYSEMFKILNVPEKYVDIHFLSKPYFKRDFDLTLMREFHDYLSFLKNWNTENNEFNHSLFLENIDTVWDKLFYHIPYGNKEMFELYKALTGNKLGFKKWYYKKRMGG